MAKKTKTTHKPKLEVFSDVAIAYSALGKESADIKLSQTDHNSLLEYVRACIEECNTVRNDNLRRFVIVDEALAGKVDYDAADLIRLENNRKGKSEAPPTVRPAKAAVHTSKAAGNIFDLIKNDNKLYGFQPKVTDTTIITAFNDEMNQIGEYFNHEGAWLPAIKDALTYNICAAEAEWSEPYKGAEEAQADPALTVFTKDDTMPRGTVHKRISPYNLFYDITLDKDIASLSTRARYVGYSEVISWYEYQRRVEDGTYTDVEVPNVQQQLNPTAGWYSSEPNVLNGDKSSAQTDSLANAFHVMNEIAGDGSQIQYSGYLRTVMYVRLRPSMFNLKKDNKDKLHLYKLEIINGMRIARIELMGDNTEPVPMAFGRGLNPHKGSNSPSYAELLIPYQDLSAFELNLRLSAGRRELNSTVLVMDDRLKPTNHTEQANIKFPLFVDFNKLDSDKPLGNHIYSSNVAPVTYQTQQNLEALDRLMHDVLPADQAKQMAGLNRANIYQAAQVKKQTSETNVSIAIELDSQFFANLRFFTFRQYVANVDSIEYTDDQNQVVQLATESLHNKVFLSSVKDGLAGVDKHYAAESMKEVFNTMLNSPQAQTQLDMNKVIGAMFDLMNLPFDYNNLKIQTQFDMLPPEIKQALFEQFQAQQAEAQAEAGGQEQPNAAQ